MTPYRYPREPNGFEARSLPLGEIWSKFTSEIDSILTHAAATTTSPGNASPATATATTMVTTEVFTTVWRTSLTTVHLTTDVVRTKTLNGADTTSPDPTPSTTSRELTPTSLASPTAPSNPPKSAGITSTSSSSTSTRNASNGVIGTPTLTLSLLTHKPLAHVTGIPSFNATNNGSHNATAQRKHAIIGGLAGAIAGLVLIGILIVFCLRKRRRKNGASDEPVSEKGVRPAMARKWSEFTARHSTSTVMPPVSHGTNTPDIDGGLIRMSLDRWPRPYAHGEGYRESLGPRRLQVMNPSPPRPATPQTRGSSESVTRFVNRQKTAIVSVFAGGTRARAGSNGESPNHGLVAPTITIDPALSSECVAANAYAPSFRSLPSVSSTAMVEQRPPEDPFLTPPDERDEMEEPQTKPRRPGIAPLQSAASVAARTLSNIGSALNPFRSKSYVNESVTSASVSRRSVISSSSAGDPFHYDRPSLRNHRDTGSTWQVYEGT